MMVLRVKGLGTFNTYAASLLPHNVTQITGVISHHIRSPDHVQADEIRQDTSPGRGILRGALEF